MWTLGAVIPWVDPIDIIGFVKMQARMQWHIEFKHLSFSPAGGLTEMAQRPYSPGRREQMRSSESEQVDSSRWQGSLPPHLEALSSHVAVGD